LKIIGCELEILKSLISNITNYFTIARKNTAQAETFCQLKGFCLGTVKIWLRQFEIPNPLVRPVKSNSNSNCFDVSQMFHQPASIIEWAAYILRYNVLFQVCDNERCGCRAVLGKIM
jgi:hypothetical protein